MHQMVKDSKKISINNMQLSYDNVLNLDYIVKIIIKRVFKSNNNVFNHFIFFFQHNDFFFFFHKISLFDTSDKSSIISVKLFSFA